MSVRLFFRLLQMVAGAQVFPHDTEACYRLEFKTNKRAVNGAALKAMRLVQLLDAAAAACCCTTLFFLTHRASCDANGTCAY